MSDTTLPRNNTLIWRNWSAVPRLRVLFDRKGMTNREVFNYLVKRFGWDGECDVRDLQFQVSQAKVRFKSPEKIWRIYRLKREFGIGDGDFTRYRAGVAAKIARDSVRKKIERNSRIPVAEFAEARLSRPPKGYALKWVMIEGTKSFQAWCPQIGTGCHEMIENEDSVAA